MILNGLSKILEVNMGEDAQENDYNGIFTGGLYREEEIYDQDDDELTQPESDATGDYTPTGYKCSYLSSIQAVKCLGKEKMTNALRARFQSIQSKELDKQKEMAVMQKRHFGREMKEYK